MLIFDDGGDGSVPRAINVISIEFKIWSALVPNMLNRSQINFAHVTTVTLSRLVQTFVVIGRMHLNLGIANFGRISNSIEIALVGRGRT